MYIGLIIEKARKIDINQAKTNWGASKFKCLSKYPKGYIMYIANAKRKDGWKMTTATVYMTDTCPYCKMMIRYLKERNVKVRTINVARDQRAAQRLMSITGQMGVPQTEINGQWIIGFDPQSVERALRR